MKTFSSYHASNQSHWAEGCCTGSVLLQDNKLHIIFTRRTELVLDHKGQVAFPGGAVEPDVDSTQTAKRMLRRIGVKPEEVEVLGRMKDYMTISDFVISPVIGFTQWKEKYLTSPNEVNRVFSLPVDF